MEICLAILLQYKSLVHSYPELLGLSGCYLYLSDCVGLMTLLVEMSWAGQSGIATKNRQLELPVLNVGVFCCQERRRSWQEPWCRGIWNPWLLATDLQWSLDRMFHNAMCVFSVVPGLASRAVDVQSCSSENECSFGGGWKWLTGGMRISFNKINQL